MKGLKGVWLLIAFALSVSLYSLSPHCESLWQSPNAIVREAESINVLFQDDKVLKTNMFSKYRSLPTQNTSKVFNIAELSISSPYLPFCQNQHDSTSQASLNLVLPEAMGGISLNGGVAYQIENIQKQAASPKGEHVFYVVSTKSIAEAKWKPFVSVSYIRSEVRGISKTRNLGNSKFLFNNFSSQAKYANTEVMGACCGLKPFENLSLVLSYNYLKPLHKGVRLSNHKTKVFDELKMASHNQNVDIKLDYAVRDGLNFLVKSEYLVPNNTLKDTVDAPVLIEGHLIVSF